MESFSRHQFLQKQTKNSKQTRTHLLYALIYRLVGSLELSYLPRGTSTCDGWKLELSLKPTDYKPITLPIKPQSPSQSVLTFLNSSIISIKDIFVQYMTHRYPINRSTHLCFASWQLYWCWRSWLHLLNTLKPLIP